MMEAWDYYPRRKPKPLRKSQPTTRMGWAEFYGSRLPSPEADHLCWWYLILHYAFDDLTS